MSEITQDINRVICELNQGRPVAIPTETVYGLAAKVSDEAAIRQVYSLKQRPLSHPLIVHVHPDEDLSLWVENVSYEARQLIDAFWPGPLTLVFDRKKGAVLDIITAGQETVAIRCPAHPWTQKILEKAGEPLVAPSANPFGKVSPTSAAHVLESFRHDSLLIFDGGRCEHGIESTIVSVTKKLSCQVLRPGAISQDIIENHIGLAQSVPPVIRVPGQLKQHYQPHKQLNAFETHDALLTAYLKSPKPHYVMAFVEDSLFDSKFFYKWPESPEDLMYELYHQLRLADASDARAISIVLPPNEPQWRALRDRMIKASS